MNKMVNNKLKLVKSATAFVIGAAVLTGSFAAAGSDTAFAKSSTSVKVSNGKLVYKSTGKVVKGYKTYNKALYKDGKKLTGLYKKTYYKAGKKATGTYKSVYYKAGKAFTGVTNKTYYKVGKKATGTYKNVYYKSGKAYTGVVNKTYYKAGKKATGLYKGVYYKTGKAATGIYKDQLYVSGNLNKGLTVYKDQLYKDAVLNKGLVVFKDQLYKDAALNKGLIEFEGKFYFDAALANDTYTDQGVERAFENGVEVGAKVKSVEAINGSQLKVTFNKSVDTTTAEDEGNYSLDNTTLTSSNAKAELQDDSKTVILTLNTAYNNTTEHTVAVTINGILEDGSTTSKLPKFSTVIKVNDKVAAEVSSVDALTNGSTVSEVTVNYSEPVQGNAVIKIDGTKVATTTAGESQTISGLSLDSTKEHTVEIVNLTDAAGNVNAVATSKFTATKDTTAPEIKSVTQLNDKEFVVEFSEKIKASTLTAGDFKLINSSTLAAVNPTDVQPLSGDTTGTKYVVTTDLTASSYTTVTSIPLTVAVADKAFTDIAGNENVAANKSVTLSKDTVAPVLVSTKTTLASNGDVASVTFTFDENVKSTSAVFGDVEVVTENGILDNTLVTGYSVSGKSVTLNIKSGVKSGKFSIALPAGFVTDVSTALNKSAKVEKVFDFGNAETAKEYTITSAVNAITAGNVNTITVEFGTNVVGGAFNGSATNINAYTLNGKKLSEYAGAKVVLVDQDTAKITLPAGSIATSDDAAVLQISGVKSTTGLTNKLFTTVLTNLTDNVAPTLESAQLLADGKTFVLTYNENLSTSLTGDVATAFKFTEDGKDVTVTDATIKSVSGKTVIVEAPKAVTTTTEAIKAPKAGFYKADGTAYVEPTSGTITSGGVTYTYKTTSDFLADGTTPVTTAGFYAADDTLYTEPTTGTITVGGVTYTYYAKDAEIVAAKSSTTAGTFNTSKVVTIETVAAADKVEDVKGNDQNEKIKLTTTR
uniref:S-layer n=1 Tax=Viridibacillus arvi TaxID=263475 RepID=A0A0K2Z2U9_9BACL|nr:S-layer [Viridibacillus arvi]